MNYLFNAFLVVFPLSIVAIGVLTIFSQRRLGKHRGVSREEFVQAFEGRRIPSEIPAAVYDYYKARVISKDFCVAPDDDYEKVFSESEEDIDDDAEFLLKKLGLKIPYDPELAQPEGRIRTLRDMVYWLDQIRQHQPPAWS